MRSIKHFSNGHEESYGRKKPYDEHGDNHPTPYGGGDELHKSGQGDIKDPSKPINPNAIKPKPKTGPSKENPNYPPNKKDTPGDSIHSVQGSKKPNPQPKPKPDPKAPKEPRSSEYNKPYLEKGSSKPNPQPKPKFPGVKKDKGDLNKKPNNEDHNKPPRDNPPAGGVKPKPKHPKGPTPVGARVEFAKK